MGKHNTTTVTLVTALVLTGIVAMPVQAQVNPDCDEKAFDIPDSEPPTPRDLPAQTSEVGRIMVSGANNVTVVVQVTSEDTLNFGVFTDEGECETDLDSSCGDDEEVKTESVIDPDEEECVLQPGKEYFFHLVNEGGSSLDYKIWED